MPQSLAHVTLLVRDYDEALDFFTQSLGFRVEEDTSLAAGKRWLIVAPPGSRSTSLLLAQADTPEQVQLIGKQGAGRVFLILHTDDFSRDYQLMQASNVKFLEPPRRESYGTVAVFEDLYGNKWDLLQPCDGNAPKPRPLPLPMESR
jgi:catechol 2,3-dioxygenase-like lactoylglutathione lyase family enzyme